MSESNNKRTRKNNQQIKSEYESVLTLMNSGKTPLEIQAELNINYTQFTKYVAKAAINGYSWHKSEYKTIRGVSFPKIILELLGAEKDSVIKVSKGNSNNEVILSVIPRKVESSEPIAHTEEQVDTHK
jgi:hypothetical protein